MTGLFNLSADLALAVGLVVAAAGIVFVTKIGLLPKKSVPYALLALGGAFGIAWFKSRQARTLRQRLKDEEERLKALEERLREQGARLGDADARLDAARTEVDARRAAIEESILELERTGDARIEEVSRLSGEELDAEMTALLARLSRGS
jgi:hypothetical protein